MTCQGTDRNAAEALRKYENLPKGKKMKYIQDYQRKKQEFERNVAKLREVHPDVPEKPKTPQQLRYNHERTIYLKIKPDSPPEEQKRALAEEKMVGLNKKPSQASRVTAQDSTELKSKAEKKAPDERGKLAEMPKTAEEIWQQSVIGYYLARFKNNRAKAIKCMESTWLNMKKEKEKIMWLKKAEEDQKRFEGLLQLAQKLQGELQKAPMNGCQTFSQELVSNGELEWCITNDDYKEDSSESSREEDEEEDGSSSSSFSSGDSLASDSL